MKELHQEASSLFLALIDEQHQQTVEKILNTLTNVTSEDLHAFEIFEHHIDQFHRLPHFCTQLQNFDVSVHGVGIICGSRLRPITTDYTHPANDVLKLTLSSSSQTQAANDRQR